MREDGVEFLFLERLFEPPELDRNIVKPARSETAIEMPQSRHDDSYNRHLDVGARLIEDEEIEALPLSYRHAGRHLLVRFQVTELRIELCFQHFAVARQEEGMIREP